MHDPRLLDALGVFTPERFDGCVYRGTRKSLNPITSSTSGGRWARKGDVAVLYTSLARDGALSEIAHHWGQFRPRPTGPVLVTEIRCSLSRTLHLDRGALETLDVDWTRYADQPGGRTQEIGSAAAFLGYEALIAPSARAACDNLMVFTENLAPTASITPLSSEEVDWIVWAQAKGLL